MLTTFKGGKNIDRKGNRMKIYNKNSTIKSIDILWFSPSKLELELATPVIYVVINFGRKTNSNSLNNHAHRGQPTCIFS